MNTNRELEKEFLNLALKYKKEYENTPWWRFLKRKSLKKNWKSCMGLMVRYSIKAHDQEEFEKLINKIKEASHE